MKAYSQGEAQAMFGAGVSSGYHRLGGGVPGKLVKPAAFKFIYKDARVPGDMSVPDPRASSDDPPSMSPGLPDKKYLRLEAVGRGYTGDECVMCHNFTMVHNGTCLKCDTCGSTTGCS